MVNTSTIFLLFIVHFTMLLVSHQSTDFCHGPIIDEKNDRIATAVLCYSLLKVIHFFFYYFDLSMQNFELLQSQIFLWTKIL